MLTSPAFYHHHREADNRTFITCGTGDGMTPEEQFIPYRPTNLRDTTPIQQGQVRSGAAALQASPS